MTTTFITEKEKIAKILRERHYNLIMLGVCRKDWREIGIRAVLLGQPQRYIIEPSDNVVF